MRSKEKVNREFIVDNRFCIYKRFQIFKNEFGYYFDTYRDLKLERIYKTLKGAKTSLTYQLKV